MNTYTSDLKTYLSQRQDRKSVVEANQELRNTVGYVKSAVDVLQGLGKKKVTVYKDRRKKKKGKK